MDVNPLCLLPKLAREQASEATEHVEEKERVFPVRERLNEDIVESVNQLVMLFLHNPLFDIGELSKVGEEQLESQEYLDILHHIVCDLAEEYRVLLPHGEESG